MNNPYFGRAFQIQIAPQGDGPTITIVSSPSAPSLHVEFSTDLYLGQFVRSAQVTIFNLSQGASGVTSALSLLPANAGPLDALSINSTLAMGDTVSIAAGYQSPSGSFNPTANLLYEGNLLQSIATREEVTDTKLILRCITNLAANMFASSNFQLPKNSTDWTALSQAMKDAGLPDLVLGTTIDSMSQQILQNTPYPFSQTHVGRPVDIISDLLRQHPNIYSWQDANGLNIKSVQSLSGALTPDYAYGPPNLSSYTTGGTTSGVIKPTLIGYPQGTQNGATFRVLMDPSVKIWDIVQIAPGTSINSFQFNYMDLPPLPNAQGIYVVAGIRHVGDSRGKGPDWFTEIVGVTPSFLQTRSGILSVGGATTGASQ